MNATSQIPTESEYKANEITRFLKGEGPFFDNVKDFADHWQNASESDFLTQLQWVENGSYGAGACLVLEQTWKEVKDNHRVNKQARIGRVFLRALYGAEFPEWNKLPEDLQVKINGAVKTWIDSEKEFSIEN